MYILQSQKDSSFYVGYTCDDLVERLAKHNRPHKGYTSRKQPWVLVYSESFGSKQQAMEREREVKSWKSKKRIKELIHSKG